MSTIYDEKNTSTMKTVVPGGGNSKLQLYNLHLKLRHKILFHFERISVTQFAIISSI